MTNLLPQRKDARLGVVHFHGFITYAKTMLWMHMIKDTVSEMILYSGCTQYLSAPVDTDTYVLIWS